MVEMSDFTPIENRAAWRAYTKAFQEAKERGADFHCAVAVGFAATNKPPSKASVCEKCRRKGVA